MGTSTKKFNPAPFVTLFIACACLLPVSACTRYARTVNMLYEPSAPVRSGSGMIYIVIPESRQTHSSDVKWVLGKVTDKDNTSIDELISPRSPAEIIQGAFSGEFRKAGYTVIPVTVRPAAEQWVIELTKTEIGLGQISDLAVLKAECRVLVGVDVFKSGQLLKRLQYESTASRTDIKDRDTLAGSVLEDALRSVMLEAVPELHSLLTR